ncbi:MAG: hydrogenase maturation protease [Candidatus Brocadiia bacterium]
MPETAVARVVVLGVGNELMKDEGVGVAVVRRLSRRGHDRRIAPLEAGTALLDALDLVPPGAAVLVVDAASAGGEPGSVYRLRLDDVGTGRGVSLHETSLPEAFAAARLGGARFGPVVVLGIEPADVAVGTELSERLEKKLPAILDTVCDEARRLLDAPRGV